MYYSHILIVGVCVRTAMAGALFKKSVGLHVQTVRDLSVGKIMALSSNDVRRFDNVSYEQWSV